MDQKQKIIKGMSQTGILQGESIASEPDKLENIDTTPSVDDPGAGQKPQQEDREKLGGIYSTNAKFPTAQTPQNTGEQSASGTMPAPESDDDTLNNAQSAGYQPQENTENPQSVDAGSDTDKAEREIP